jgi:anaerobic magnesium-protoporphyrin IX monomethyl ester cyclase
MRENILVINPNARINSPFAAIEPPLWAGLIASYLKADILDAEAENFSVDETTRLVYEQKPTLALIVVMGNNPSVSSTPKMPAAEKLAYQLDNLGINVALTGIHPIAAGSKFRVIKKPFEGLTDMPFHLLPMEKYRAHNWHCLGGIPRSPYASIYTSLGCPFNCYYCNIHTLYNSREVQFRPIGSILAEIETLVVNYKVRNIKFWDELFALKEERVITICECLADYDLNIWAYARLDTITERMLKSMYKGGVRWLGYGFESISDPKFVDRTEDIIKMTRDAGINIMANFMFGLPNQILSSDMIALEFAMKHLFEFVNFYVARPYPGSQWYADIKPSTAWNDYSQFSKAPTTFRDRAFNAYFNNPDYLSMVERKFGIEGVKDIKAMLDFGKPVQSG